MSGEYWFFVFLTFFATAAVFVFIWVFSDDKSTKIFKAVFGAKPVRASKAVEFKAQQETINQILKEWASDKIQPMFGMIDSDLVNLHRLVKDQSYGAIIEFRHNLEVLRDYNLVELTKQLKNFDEAINAAKSEGFSVEKSWVDYVFKVFKQIS